MRDVLAETFAKTIEQSATNHVLYLVRVTCGIIIRRSVAQWSTSYPTPFHPHFVRLQVMVLVPHLRISPALADVLFSGEYCSPDMQPHHYLTQHLCTRQVLFPQHFQWRLKTHLIGLSATAARNLRMIICGETLGSYRTMSLKKSFQIFPRSLLQHRPGTSEALHQ